MPTGRTSVTLHPATAESGPRVCGAKVYVSSAPLRTGPCVGVGDVGRRAVARVAPGVLRGHGRTGRYDELDRVRGARLEVAEAVVASSIGRRRGDDFAVLEQLHGDACDARLTVGLQAVTIDVEPDVVAHGDQDLGEAEVERQILVAGVHHIGGFGRDGRRVDRSIASHVRCGGLVAG